MNRTIKDIGERTLLKMFEELVDVGDLPFNDDAVAFSLSEDLSLVINIDTFVAKTDAPPGMSPYQMGAKTTTMAISDLGAKGVQPLFTLASGAFPSNYDAKKTVEIVKGIKETSNNYGAKYLGGDTNEADDIILSVVSAGTANKNKLIKRNGAQVGDIIFTTGYFGFTGAGFKVFLDQYEVKDLQLEKFKEAVYNPKARLKEGLLLAKYGKISSCIDSSDGLAWCLVEILRGKEQYGIAIDNIPIDETVIEFAKENNLKAYELALYAGEEFELVFTINPNNLESLNSFMKKNGVKIFPLGKIIKNSTNKILLETESEIIEIQPKGWEHFK
ncbi:MAG: thiamine-phosphate kinase [Candidatus Heimdallarchaeota archaeon]